MNNNGDAITPGSANTDHWVRSARVQNFRGFRDLTLNNCGRINLITGYNNVGKTALLEAIHLRSALFVQNFTLLFNAGRGIPGFLGVVPGVDAPWDAWFHDFDIDAPITVTTTDLSDAQSVYTLRPIRSPQDIEPSLLQQVLPQLNLGVFAPGQDIKAAFEPSGTRILESSVSSSLMSAKVYSIYVQNSVRTFNTGEVPAIPSVFRPSRQEINPNELAQQFGQLELRRRIPNLVHNLQMIEPRITDVTMIFSLAGPQLHGDIGLGRLLPLKVMGEGTAKLASLMIDASTATGGTLFIDEIENGFHYSVLEKLWASIDEATEAQQVQFFATTHSLECIEAAYRHFTRRFPVEPSQLPAFRVFRLDRTEDDVDVVDFDLASLGNALSLGFEIR